MADRAEWTEIMNHKAKGHLIKYVQPSSIAQEMGVECGDILLAINDEELEDVFDYRYLIEDEQLEVLVQKPDGEQWLLDIEKDYDEDLGIEFENDLMSEYHSCHNKCMFCFIDQMPPGMRDTLYFKDDDSRLSFLQGNYITLTNMKDKDVDRIIRFHLAPINISVHTTNPELRCEMLHNRFAGDVLKYLDRLYESRVEMNGQIVLCKGVNDGEELERTIRDLSRLLPFMRSLSVVPAGVTKYREGLYPLEMFTKEEAGDVIDMIERWQEELHEEYGLHFVHASDEFYLLAEREFPEEERYDGYIQLENGVGMMRLLCEEFMESLQKRINVREYTSEREGIRRTCTIATGKLAYPMLSRLAGALMEKYPHVKIEVVCIRNDFFGETITVAGLITAQDLVAQLRQRREEGGSLGDTLLITANMLRMGENVFLDDWSTEDVERELGMRLCIVDSEGEALLQAMLDADYSMGRLNDRGLTYIQAYDGEKK